MSNEAKIMLTGRVDRQTREAIQLKADFNNETLSDAFRDAIAKGFRFEMIEAGVDPYFLTPLTPEGLTGYYLDFMDAVRSGSHRLEKPPAGGVWEAKGVTGFAVLAKFERFTRDGIEIVHN